MQLIWAVGGSQGAYRIGEGSSGQLSRRLSAASVSPVTGSLLLLGDFGLDDISFGNITLARVCPSARGGQCYCRSRPSPGSQTRPWPQDVLSL